MKASGHRPALEEPEDEEKQILITQVNAYSRECDKLKGQLQTAHDESVALREEVSYTYTCSIMFDTIDLSCSFIDSVHVSLLGRETQ